MQIYWKIGLLWYGAPTGGAANVLLELIFSQKRRGAIFGVFSKFDQWKNLEERLLWFSELLENVERCIQIERKTQQALTHYAARWQQTC